MGWVGWLITQLVLFPTKWISWSVLQFFPNDTGIDAKVGALEAGAAPVKTVKAIYGCLSILDGKASALMRFNGIILAVIALMIKSSQELPTVAYVIMYMTLASILSCLVVVGVFWRFYEFVDPDDANSLERELGMLRRVLVLREAAYQLAWWLAGAVSILLILHFADFVKQVAAN